MSEARQAAKKDMIAGAFLFVFAAVYFALSFQIQLTFIDQIVGSRKFPQICGILMMFLGVSIFLQGLRAFRTAPAQTSSAESAQEKGLMELADDAENAMPESKETQTAQKLRPQMKVALVLISYAVYIYLMDKIGFPLASFLYLFSQLILMGTKALTKKRLLYYLILSAALAFGIYALFYYGFSLLLPRASWF